MNRWADLHERYTTHYGDMPVSDADLYEFGVAAGYIEPVEDLDEYEAELRDLGCA